jgi:hypothetical protein
MDGLDEVSSSNYPRIAATLNALSVKLQQLGENNAIVLTLRTQFHQQTRVDFDDNYPTVLSVKRFSPSDIYEFLTRWPFASSTFENVVRIYNDLTDRPSLREMCTNPLVLSMYVAQDQIAGYQIAPESRTEFYSKVADELLIKRRAKQVGALNAQAVVREQRQRILGRIAFDHRCDPDQSPNHLVWVDAINVVMEVNGIKRRDEAEQYLRELAKETGLIGEEQEGESFRFIHLTFCEFFCAFESVHGRSDGWLALLSTHKSFRVNPALRSRLVESLPFATALLPRHMKDEAVDQIASCNDPHLLAMTFLETKNYAHRLWAGFVDGSIASLNEGSRQNWDADWLRELHLFLVVASDAERSAKVTQGIAKSDAVTMFFRAFAKQEAVLLSKLIASYAEQDAAAAFRVASLCEVDLLNDVPEVIVASCSQPPFIAVALERALREPALTNLWASLFAEGGLRSRAAASALSNRTRLWQQNVVEQIPLRLRWSNSGCYPDSFYIDCISLGWHARLNQNATPLLNILSDIPPPNALAWSGLIRLCVRFRNSGIVLLYGICGVGTFLLANRVVAIDSPIVISTLGVGLAVLCLLMIGVSSGSRFQLYQTVLNLRVNVFLSPALILRVAIRSILDRRYKHPTLASYTVEGGETRWIHYLCPGPFRSFGLVSLSRRLIVQRDSESLNSWTLDTK